MLFFAAKSSSLGIGYFVAILNAPLLLQHIKWAAHIYIRILKNSPIFKNIMSANKHLSLFVYFSFLYI